MSLTTLPPNANIVVAGASGGIGGEFVRQLAANERVGRVFALHRSSVPDFGTNVTPLAYDLADEE